MSPGQHSVTVNQHLIKTLVKYCIAEIDRLPKRPTNGYGGLYYRMIVKHAEDCRRRGLANVDGLPCYLCTKIIPEDTDCISKAKGNGRKYYHILCARKVNIID